MVRLLGFAQGTRSKTFTARAPASLEDLDGRLLKGDETRHVEFR